ncbi:Protein of unknown function [Fibrobacter sp. UWB15]|uniref:DUF2971 domain-containing protein n=1 Tax=unclassified Fibrobacter TaxID=2634177 RepID=UPI00091D6D2C|nr:MULTISPECIES: DUF2971 domain-containing protein [unclassified Fibrobacter]PWJ63495.1 Protein of unknown function (DUF2971) [Fibrobacter sp. UWB6]SHG30642.1 Protein of unknown function [Fibrobacter sp. UWB8]SMG36448.1 Protein of unknown function [Fibrobacter sp. UWB15]
MKPTTLYKYLGIDGGLKMMKCHNLRFANATRLNDPFDCHYELIDFSKVPAEKCKMWPADVIEELESCHYKNLRKRTWICSLSKVYDSLLMWCFYSSYSGVCIGIDMEKTEKYLSRVMNGVFFGPQQLEVQYKDIVNKPNFFYKIDMIDYTRYQLSTKAKEWEHEKEVRLLLTDPGIGEIPSEYSDSDQKEDGSVDYEDVRFYPVIGRECFCELYLGINVEKEKQNEILKVARWLNPEMKIYRMTVDPDAFKLKPVLIQ